jgi:ABC-2 type transport system permease protein
MRRIGLLLGKDLRVLGRLPALAAALLLYPLAVAVLVGLVVRYAGDRPPVAFVDLDNLPEVLEVGGHRFDIRRVLDEVDDEVDLVPLDEAEANRRLETGEVLAAIVVPRGFASRLRGMVQTPTLVLETSGGGLAGEIERRMEALVYNLNRLLQDTYIEANLDYINLLLRGGQGSFLGNDFDIIGLAKAGEALAEIERKTADPAVAAEVRELQVFVREASLAIGQSEQALRATANPIGFERQGGGGRSYLLSAQVQAYAIALTLIFLCVLLAAAAVASERDENVIGRLARGPVRLGELVAEKVLLAVAVAVALGVVLAIVFGAAVEIADAPGGQPWERLPLLVLALALAGTAFGGFGVLLGALAGEGRTATLLSFLVVLPLVLVGLVPRGSLEAAGWASEAFPFKHAVRVLQSALYDGHPWATIGNEAAWLLGLALLFGAAARLGVRRLV